MEFRKFYKIAPGDKISWIDTEEGILLKKEEEDIELEDIIGMIKEELPYDCVEIKKRGAKGLKWK